MLKVGSKVRILSNECQGEGPAPGTVGVVLELMYPWSVFNSIYVEGQPSPYTDNKAWLFHDHELEVIS